METNTGVTQLSEKEQALLKAKSAAERKFELVIAEMTEEISICNNIVISDSTTFAMANQHLSKLNNALKNVEERRKDTIRNSQEYIDFVNGLIKSKLTNPAKLAIDAGKEKLRKWNEAETKRNNDLKEADNKKLAFLQSCQINIQKQVELVDSPERCDTLIDKINEEWPADEKFGNYSKEAITSKNNFITLLQTKKIALKGALSNNLSIVTESIEKVAEVLEEQKELSVEVLNKQEFIQDGMVAEIGAVRRTWTWEIVDESKLPREFLSIDEKKVNAYMKLHKAEFDINGTIRGSVRFYQDAAPQIK